MPKSLLVNASIATMKYDESYGLITMGAIVIENGRFSWVGKMSDLPVSFTDPGIPKVDCKNRLVTPGLIDCHSHIVYAGNRASEFEQRLEGASYEDIAKKGGGIVSTVKATRGASEEELYQQALPRLNRLMNEGVTTIEIKSGYGLNCESEIKMLRVAERLGNLEGIRVKKTFLGAHAVPGELDGRKNDYINEVCNTMLPAAIDAGLVDAVDGFCEGIGFSVKQIEKVFDKAISYNLPIKLHAEQLSDMGGAVMAAKKGALSVDHIEYLSQDSVPILAENATIAVLLPGAFYVLRESQLPPIDALRNHKVPIAIATDLNPGSSPIHSLLLIMNMACVLFSLTPREALAGVTINAARALGLQAQIGSIEKCKCADLVIWDTDNPAMLSYQIALNSCIAIMVDGKWKRRLNRH